MNIRILKTNITGNKIIVEYEVNKSMQNLTVNAALVQDKAVTQIRAGENRGVKLINYNVVRDFAAAKLPGTTGTSTLQLPPGNNAAGYHVVLFLQQDDSGKIIAVVRSTL